MYRYRQQSSESPAEARKTLDRDEVGRGQRWGMRVTTNYHHVRVVVRTELRSVPSALPRPQQATLFTIAFMFINIGPVGIYKT